MLRSFLSPTDTGNVTVAGRRFPSWFAIPNDKNPQQFRPFEKMRHRPAHSLRLSRTVLFCGRCAPRLAEEAR